MTFFHKHLASTFKQEQSYHGYQDQIKTHQQTFISMMIHGSNVMEQKHAKEAYFKDNPVVISPIGYSLEPAD